MHRDTYRKMRSCCQLIILLLLVLAPVAQAQTESVLLTFGGPAKGATPEAPLLRDSAGNFYGTASTGGPSDWGVVFKIDPAGHETGLHSFSGGDDGGDPVYGLTRDSAGNLYGTTWQTGAWYSRSIPLATRRCCTAFRAATTAATRCTV